MIPAAMFGAEAAGVRTVIVMHGPYMIPCSRNAQLASQH
jgi:hypothetical protein